MASPNNQKWAKEKARFRDKNERRKRRRNSARDAKTQNKINNKAATIVAQEDSNV